MAESNRKKRKRDTPNLYMSEEHFRQYLQKNFQIVPVKADGNCYYRAIAVFVYGNEDDHIKVREDMVNYMIQNRETIEVQLPQISYDSDLAEITEEGEWGSTVLTYIVVRCYSLCVDIYQPSTNVRERILPFGDRTQESPVISISYHPELRHFNALLCNDSRQREALVSAMSYRLNCARIPRKSTQCTSDERTRVATQVPIPKLNTTTNCTLLPNHSNQAVERDVCMNVPAELFVLVPKSTTVTGIEQRLKQAEINGSTLLYTFVLKETTKHWTAIVKDISGASNYDVYTQPLVFSSNYTSEDLYLWLGEVLMIHLISTIFKTKWKQDDGNIEVMFKLLLYSPLQAIINAKLISRWVDIKANVIPGIQDVLENKPIFCLGCSDACPLSMVKWHFNLSNFKLLTRTKDFNSTTFPSQPVFGSEECARSKLPVWKSLAEIDSIHTSSIEKVDKLEKLLKDLDTIADPKTSYYTYLFLIEDSSDNHHYKFVYAGWTKNQRFPKDIFHNPRSPVNNILCSTTKVYLLSNIRFKRVQDAQLNHAIALEVMTRIISNARTNEELPFVLLNELGKNRKMYQNLTSDMHAEIKDFVDREVPIFRCQDQPEIPWKGKYVHGNLVIGKPENISPGIFLSRKYSEITDYRSRFIERSISFDDKVRDQNTTRLNNDVQDSAGPLTCPRCKMVFSRRSCLLKHAESKNCGRTPCPKCGKTFRNSNLSRHLKSCGLRCPYCNKGGFADRAQLRNHSQIHLPRVSRALHCPYCKTVYYDQKSVRNHIRNNCKKFSLNFKCPMCQFSSDDPTAALVHVAKCKPTTFLLLTCPICFGQFWPQQFPHHVHKELLSTQLSVLLKFKKKCPNCSVKLPNADALEAHFEISCNAL